MSVFGLRQITANGSAYTVLTYTIGVISVTLRISLAGDAWVVTGVSKEVFLLVPVRRLD